MMRARNCDNIKVTDEVNSREKSKRKEKDGQKERERRAAFDYPGNGLVSRSLRRLTIAI